MATFDIIVLIPIAYMAFKGYQNGIIKEVLSIVGIILAVFLAINYLEPAQQFVSSTWGLKGNYAAFTAGILIFAVVMIATHIAIMFINKVLAAVALSPINKLVGLAFGALKSGIFISLILLLIAGFNMPAEETRSSSITYPVLINLAPASYSTLATIYPGAEDFAATIQKTIDEHNPLNSYNLFK